MKELSMRVLLSALVTCALTRTPLVLPANAADVISRGQPRKVDFIIDFSGYTGVSVDHWLRAKGFKFEKDARDTVSYNFPLPTMPLFLRLRDV